MNAQKPGPAKGSKGARKIAEAHRGAREHDKKGGFAANPELAREAGKKGGDIIKKKYGSAHYQEIGRIGGAKVKAERGLEFYAEIGHIGGTKRAERIKAAQQ